MVSLPACSMALTGWVALLLGFCHQPKMAAVAEFMRPDIFLMADDSDHPNEKFRLPHVSREDIRGPKSCVLCNEIISCSTPQFEYCSFKSTGCATQFVDASQTSILRMGCSNHFRRDLREARQCNLGAKGVYICACGGDNCNFAELSRVQSFHMLPIPAPAAHLDEPQQEKPSFKTPEFNNFSVSCATCNENRPCYDIPIPVLKCPLESIGCFTSYMDPEKSAVMMMGCSNMHLASMRGDDSTECILGADSKYRCFCRGNRCNVRQAPTSSKQVGMVGRAPALTFRCWACEGVEQCDAPTMETTHCNPLDGYQTCVTVFGSLDDARRGIRSAQRGCSKVRVSMFKCGEYNESSHGSHACWCNGAYCNYRDVRTNASQRSSPVRFLFLNLFSLLFVLVTSR